MRKDDNSGLNGLTHVFVAMGAVAFFVAGAPILDAFGGWVSNLFGLQSVKLNAKAGEIANTGVEEKSEELTHCIGFQIPSEEDVIDEPED